MERNLNSLAGSNWIRYGMRDKLQAGETIRSVSHHQTIITGPEALLTLPMHTQQQWAWRGGEGRMEPCHGHLQQGSLCREQGTHLCFFGPAACGASEPSIQGHSWCDIWITIVYLPQLSSGTHFSASPKRELTAGCAAWTACPLPSLRTQSWTHRFVAECVNHHTVEVLGP